jgi:hypothetical protein
MRTFVLILIFVLSVNSYSQNKQVLYDFAGLPQTLLLNPGLETNFAYHLGLPLVSGFSAEIGSTGFSISDLFGSGGGDVTDKITAVLDNLDATDYLKINSQIEVFSAGYRFNEKTYLSFGFYEEFDLIFYLPKDLLSLATAGNVTPLGRSFDFSQLNFNADFLGVIHAGITRRVNKKLTIGGRFKIYSSALNAESKNNSGTFRTTTPGDNNISTSKLENINITYKTSGLIDINRGTFLKNTFLGGNLGVGADFGFSYQVTPQLKISGSVVDVGFINHSKSIENTTRISEEFITEGLDFQFDGSLDYWEALEDRFKQEVPEVINTDAYISWRPAKINLAVKYNFGEELSEYHYGIRYKETYTHTFGAQLYSIFSPLQNQFALTGFYERAFIEGFQTKITYTVDDYSSYNVGIGISMQYRKVNFYAIFDNITKYTDLSSANNVSLQFGFNLLFN